MNIYNFDPVALAERLSKNDDNDDDDTPTIETSQRTIPLPVLKTYVCANCSRVCVTTCKTDSRDNKPTGCPFNRMFKWQEVKK